MFPQLPWLTPWKRLATILAGNVNDAAEMLIVQGGANYRINVAQLKTLFGGGGAGAVGVNGEGINAPAFRTALGIDSLNFVDALPVANQAARLALSAAAARNVLVKEADSGKAYMLVANGTPTNNSDWILFSDITTNIEDIPGLQDELNALSNVKADAWNSAGGQLFEEPEEASESITVSRPGFYSIVNPSNSSSSQYGSIFIPNNGVSFVHYRQLAPTSGTQLIVFVTGVGSLIGLNSGEGALCVPDGSGSMLYIKLPAASGNMVTGAGGGITDPAAFRTALQLTQLNLVDAIPVANQAARLALTADQARNSLVKQADNGRSYMLTAAGVPSVNGDWIEIGDSAITISDVTGLQTQIDAMLASIAAAGVPAEGEEMPADTRYAVEIDLTGGDLDIYNGVYEDHGLVFNNRPILHIEIDPTSGHFNQPHFVYQNGRWEFWNETATLMAYAEDGTELWPTDAVGWVLASDDVTPAWSTGDFALRAGFIFTAGAAGDVIRYQNVDYHCYVEQRPGANGDFIVWKPITTAGVPFDGDVFDTNGYDRYTMAGTTIPATSGTVLNEVLPSILNTGDKWCSGAYNFLETPPATGIWILMRRHATIAGSWEVLIYQNGVLSQSYRSLPDGTTRPPLASSKWLRTSGSSSAGMSLTRQLNVGTPGKIGQTVQVNPTFGDPRQADTYVCTRDFPYCSWQQLATNAAVEQKLDKTGSNADQSLLTMIGAAKKGLWLSDANGDGTLRPKDALGFYAEIAAGLFGKQGFGTADTSLPGWYVFLDEGPNRWVVDYLYEGVMTNMGWQADSAIDDIDDEDGSTTWSALGTHSAGGTLTVQAKSVAALPTSSSGWDEVVPVRPGGLAELTLLSQRRRHCGGLGGNTSSVGGEGQTTDGEFSVFASTGANAFARARLARNLTSFSGSTGAGISCVNDIDIAGVLMASVTGGGKIRIVVGDDGTATPPIATANALTSRGWGFEITNPSGASLSARVFAHDGTAYDSSPEVLIVSSGNGLGTNIPFILRKEGGRITLLLGERYASGATPTPAILPVIRLDDTAPTTGATTGSYVSLLAVNPNAAVTTTLARMHCEVITDIRK